MTERRSNLIAATLAMMVVASSQAAGADAGPAPSPAAIAQARERYARGHDLWAKGAKTEACTEFREAYALAATDKLLFELSLCDETTGKLVDAVKKLETYEARLGPTLAPERRVEVTAQLASIRSRIARVVVRTNVPDAEIVVDDAAVGQTRPEPFLVDPGRRRVWASRAGYYPSSKEIIVNAGEQTEVVLDLAKMTVVAPPRQLVTRTRIIVAATAAVVLVFAAVLIGRGRRRKQQTRSVVPKIDVFASSSAEDQIIEPTPDNARRIVCDDDATHEPAPNIAPLAIHHGGRTDIGLVKPSNQDSMLLAPEHGVFVVADGIGGYAGGEVASATTVEVLSAALGGRALNVGLLTHLPRPAAELARAVFDANVAIRRKAKADWNLADMGTTCVAVRFFARNQRVCVAHIGDSRVYRFRKHQLLLLTTDHTMENIGAVGTRAGHLASALGAEPCPKIDVLLASSRPGDLYLLCSDGLTKMVSETDIAGALTSSGDAVQAANTLVELANRAGGKDNVTAVIVAVTPAGAS